MVVIQKDKKYIYVIFCILLIAAGVFTNIEYGFALCKIGTYAVLSTGCLIIARIDYIEHRIPNKILLFLLLIRVVILLTEIIWGGITGSKGWSFMNLFHSFVGLLIGLIVMLFVYVISRHAIGMGDVKLSAIIGFFMGTAGWYTALILGSILAAGFSIVQLIRKKMKLKDEIPLGPFLAAGVVIAVIIGA